MYSPTVPGWYPDPQDITASHRWWDGARWTDAVLPQPAPPSQQATTPGFVPYATATAAAAPTVTFDASTPPRPGTQVPADCVWAEIQHPGPPARRPAFGDTSSRMAALGTIAGRTEREIVSFVGPPNSRSGVGDGGYILQWIKVASFSHSHFVLSFDKYGVCWGVQHES
ncbi:DUF2510 domain-containing protein [Nocardia fluminea]|uniref:DUF2510 domain-containing protein n=1 Tax=Nocardia fluminea TaxID=134984 RepID=UPI00364A0887